MSRWSAADPALMKRVTGYFYQLKAQSFPLGQDRWMLQEMKTDELVGVKAQIKP